MSRHSEQIGGLLTSRPMPDIVAAAGEHDAPVVCVGGALRDALLGRDAGDIDLAVAGDLDAFVAGFARHCGRTPVAIGDPWRDTRRTTLDGVQVDVGAMLGTVEEDLATRDFTINALAVRLGRASDRVPELIDLHRGAADIEARTIRMLSRQALREDPLRMLRAVRYFAALDGFEIEEATRAAIASGAAAIDRVAAERVQSEWAQLLAAPRWAEAVELIFGLGLGERTLGFRTPLDGVTAWHQRERRVDGGESADGILELRLAALVAGAVDERGAEVCATLVARRWPRRLAQRATRIARWARALVAGPCETTRWALDDRASARRAALLARALLGGKRRSRGAVARIDELQARACRAAEIPWVNGDDLRSWGLDEGPKLGALLDEVARGQIERRWQDAATAREWARRRAEILDAGRAH